jgi:transposase, IS5 family
MPFDRSSVTRWRQPLGEEQLVALIQESLSVAHKTGAIGRNDLERVVVDTTRQPKAIAHLTDARLMHPAIIKVVGLAKRNCVPLRSQDQPQRGPRSMRYMPRRLSASARGKPARLTSSAARSVSPLP